MSTFKNPVGPQPNSVYWRRRLIVGLGALVVIIVIWMIVARPFSGEPAGTTNPTESSTAPADTSTDPAATAPPVADGACNPATISVLPVTDAATYGSDANPLISLSVTNTAAEPCTMNVGTDVQEYIITSGDEQIWSSKDCQSEPAAGTTELQPGVAVTTAPFAWNRTRSDAASCDADREQIAAGGASYHLNVILDGVASADSKQFILN